ncbi:MAG: bifunctional 4-hydroxy-2-oxoglutarate aldolase/2-dehydro-3-deoxy-phosphogluconate aldolase [Verrucomicrobia bacterium]|nr:bifunctional 4-hydroxy-2-oxoglutarate aldolase/2-dehydro-3-deoxy-phosphogluconate aldolase [Verrucomicrobiota bacterium]
MRSRDAICAQLTRLKIIAIIRAAQPEKALPACEALLAGGVQAIELTMTIPNAVDVVRNVASHLGGPALIGAGTVLDTNTCRAVLDAGAQFVVSPIGRHELVAVAHGAGKPVMLGAYTPTEAQLAHEAGADFIKIFPADKLGPSYIKALRAPLPHLRIVPTGGVDVTTAADFLNAGCAALGVGSALVSADLLRGSAWAELTRRAKALVEAADAARRTP